MDELGWTTYGAREGVTRRVLVPDQEREAPRQVDLHFTAGLACGWQGAAMLIFCLFLHTVWYTPQI